MEYEDVEEEDSSVEILTSFGKILKKNKSKKPLEEVIGEPGSSTAHRHIMFSTP